MTDIPLHESRQERYGKTVKKTVTLTTEAIDTIQEYADRHNLYFSAAIESLALMGLGQVTAETLPRLIANVLERIFNRQFNRFAKMTARAAISAEEANQKADILVLQTFWREARSDPAGFENNLLISLEPHDRPDAQVRRMRDELSAEAHLSAVTLLKKPLAELSELLLPDEEASHD